jgi:hypothetical protein
MKAENVYLSHLESFGVNLNKAFELIASTPSSSGLLDWGDCFNTKSNHILWINDLENGGVYRQFPRSLYSLLQQVYPNQLKYVQKNIFSSIFFIDFTNPAHLAEIMKIATIVNQQAPLRFGIIPVLTETSSPNAKLLALAVNEIRKLDKDKLVPFVNKVGMCCIFIIYLFMKLVAGNI